MAAYEVELTARARKQYKALDPVVRERVGRALRISRMIQHLLMSRPSLVAAACSG